MVQSMVQAVYQKEAGVAAEVSSREVLKLSTCPGKRLPGV